jgi:hypothetical protein
MNFPLILIIIYWIKNLKTDISLEEYKFSKPIFQRNLYSLKDYYDFFSSNLSK